MFYVVCVEDGIAYDVLKAKDYINAVGKAKIEAAQQRCNYNTPQEHIQEYQDDIGKLKTICERQYGAWAITILPTTA